MAELAYAHDSGSCPGFRVWVQVPSSAFVKPLKSRAFFIPKNKANTFTDIPNPKSIPDFNPEPSTHETTSLNAIEWKTYIQGLKDIGGAVSLKFGMS